MCPRCKSAAEIVDEWFEANLGGEPEGFYLVQCIASMHTLAARHDQVVEDGEP